MTAQAPGARIHDYTGTWHKDTELHKQAPDSRGVLYRHLTQEVGATQAAGTRRQDYIGTWRHKVTGLYRHLSQGGATKAPDSRRGYYTDTWHKDTELHRNLA